nr:NTP transferase domain-containing protein [uncultured Methanoregula sp.]
MLRIGAIIQARMSSERLPGKVLKHVHGKPMLQYVAEKLTHCKSINEFVIATSSEKSDNAIEMFCKKHSLSCYRGSLDNVASRFQEISVDLKWDAFVRVNGDSPLIDPHLIDIGVELFRAGEYDLVTNTFPRSFPPGQSVEVVRCRTFKNIFLKLSKPEDFEHVTRYFYQNPNDFSIKNFSSGNDYSHIHLAVDTLEDFKLFSAIVSRMEKPHWEYHLSDLIHLVNQD